MGRSPANRACYDEDVASPVARVVEANGLKLRLWDHARSGPIVLFVHGYLDTGRSFDAVADDLAEFRVLALDLRGHGQSERVGAGGSYHLLDHLKDLAVVLDTLGYQQDHGVYRHPERQVIFLGDFIDRGPKIRQVLEIVRPMIESGAALAVMGNHELNAIAYYQLDPENPGQHLRPRNAKNTGQHAEQFEIPL